MKAIACMSKNRVIGRNGKLPWSHKEDMRFFKESTMYSDIVFGRETWDRMGVNHLKYRGVYVLTRQSFLNLNGQGSNSFTVYDNPHFKNTSVTYVNSLKDIRTDRTLFLGGGESLYKKYLTFCDELYLTVLDKHAEGDSYFPSDYPLTFPNFNLIKEGADFQIWHYYK